MRMRDPILEEVWQARDEHARRFNYDLKKICADLRRIEKQSGRRVVTRNPKRRSAILPPKYTPKTCCPGLLALLGRSALVGEGNQNRSDSGSMSFMRLSSPLRSGGFSSVVRGFVARTSAGAPPGNMLGCKATFSSKNRGQ